MIEKPYGKLTLEQLKTLAYQVHEARQFGQTLEPTMREAGAKKLKEILGDDFSWFEFYEFSFDYHMAFAVLIIGWQDAVKSAAQSDDPQQAFLDFVDSLDAGADWQGGYQGMFEKKHLVTIVMSLFKTIKSTWSTKNPCLHWLRKCVPAMINRFLMPCG